MEFKKIQLNGFKSFAEKTDFLIEEGLNEDEVQPGEENFGILPKFQCKS